MHLNTHTGRNVHTCPYCNIQFISRQSYESHVKVHSNTNQPNQFTPKNASGTIGSSGTSGIIGTSGTNGTTGIIGTNTKMAETSQNGPQIVSVKSINTFENEAHEEIQIEPDIIEEENYRVKYLIY